MPALDINTLFNSMLTAAKDSLAETLPTLKTASIDSLKSLAQNLVDITAMVADGSATAEQAKILFAMQKNAAQTVLLTEEGLALVAAQSAINAALAVVRGVVNTALGFSLL
jgi:Asp-tRNA(Asn)/Glu-tRNA(Gln) amidotransferase B subunit